jgi:hypothetical protein
LQGVPADISEHSFGIRDVPRRSRTESFTCKIGYYKNNGQSSYENNLLPVI